MTAQSNNSQQKNQEVPNLNKYNYAPRFFQPDVGGFGMDRLNNLSFQRQFMKKLAPRALLTIDHRWNRIPKFGEPLDDKEHLKRVYTFDGA